MCVVWNLKKYGLGCTVCHKIYSIDAVRHCTFLPLVGEEADSQFQGDASFGKELSPQNRKAQCVPQLLLAIEQH